MSNNNENSVVLKTETMEKRIDKFVKSIDDVESLAEAETVTVIQELLGMGTIRNWGALVKMVLSQMKTELQGRLEKAQGAREIVNR